MSFTTFKCDFVFVMFNDLIQTAKFGDDKLGIGSLRSVEFFRSFNLTISSVS